MLRASQMPPAPPPPLTLFRASAVGSLATVTRGTNWDAAFILRHHSPFLLLYVELESPSRGFTFGITWGAQQQQQRERTVENRRLVIKAQACLLS